MAEKNINARIIHKHDTEANWNLATNFTPKQGEIIVYDVDATHAYERFKIGDGVTNVTSLPFVTSIGVSGASVGQIIKVKEVDDLGRPTAWEVADQAQSDWNQNDETAADYIKNRPFYSNRKESLNLSLEDFTFHDDGTGMGYYTYECSEPLYVDFNLDTIHYYISGTTGSGEAFACNKTVNAHISEDGSFTDGNEYYFLTISRNSDNNLSINLNESNSLQFQGALTFILSIGVLKQIPVEYIPNEVKSLGMIGATIGQIVKVKSVDKIGAPAEWESVTDSTPFIVEFSDVETDGSCRSSEDFISIKKAADSGRHVVGHAEYLSVPGDPAQGRHNIYFDLISTMDVAEFQFVDVFRNCVIYIDVPSGAGLPYVSARSLSASSDTYGGVKADSAEETDTQPVRIGTDGKLYTAQVQSDWTQNDASKPDYIKNKPVLGTLASKSTVEKSDLSTDVQESLNKADTELAKKVDKVDGKGLSTNDYTTEEKNKLENITEYTESEIQAIWDEVMT